MPQYTLTINKKNYHVTADADTPLLWVLRDNLQLTGTKYGCGVNSCGACTVLLNNQSVHSCMMQVKTCEGKEITTIEGLSENGDHPIQKAWETVNVSQCGYCQGGQIMTAVAMLLKNKNPDRKTIDDTMSQVLCRCGTYQRIRQAIELAMQEL